MNRLWSVVLASGSVLMSTSGASPSSWTSPVREIADVNLRDVAVAVYDSTQSVIYFNPDLMSRLGDNLTTFFMAHEHSHIALKHTRAGALMASADPHTRDRLLQEKELEADCRAAKRLGRAGREASMAAVRFFSQLGDRSFDTEHPTGTARAAKILSCMPW